MGAITDLPTEDAVREALRSVEDPEVGMSIVELGLVYHIEVTPSRVQVQMTMTSPACPMGDVICDDADVAVRAVVPRDADVEIEFVWDPPWTPALMSDSARRTFGWPG